MTAPDDMLKLAELRFFRDLVDVERSNVFKAFGVIPQDYNEELPRAIQRKLFEQITSLRASAQRPTGGEVDENRVLAPALADRIELAKVALITEGHDDDGEYETTDHLEIDERHLIAAALRAYAAPSETGHGQSEVRELTADEQAGVEKALFASGTVSQSEVQSEGAVPYVAWIAFADNGNIRFWTNDYNRSIEERRRGLDLRAFTLAELVALAARAPAQASLEPVACRWRHVNDETNTWHYQDGDDANPHNEYIEVQPLYAAPAAQAWLWSCISCGSQKSMEQIRGMGALSCCPERNMAPARTECPNCHNANKCGDYEGPTCEVCMGDGFVAAIPPLPSAPAQRSPTRDDLARVIAGKIACEKDCQQDPRGCGCSDDAADAVMALYSPALSSAQCECPVGMHSAGCKNR